MWTQAQLCLSAILELCHPIWQVSMQGVRLFQPKVIFHKPHFLFFVTLRTGFITLYSLPSLLTHAPSTFTPFAAQNMKRNPHKIIHLLYIVIVSCSCTPESCCVYQSVWIFIGTTTDTSVCTTFHEIFKKRFSLKYWSLVFSLSLFLSCFK